MVKDIIEFKVDNLYRTQQTGGNIGNTTKKKISTALMLEKNFT